MAKNLSRFCFFALTLALLLLLSSSAWAAFVITKIDGNATSTQYGTSQALDSSKYPWVAYSATGSSYLHVTHYDGSNWAIERVYPGNLLAAYPDIAIDNSDTVHVSYSLQTSSTRPAYSKRTTAGGWYQWGTNATNCGFGYDSNKNYYCFDANGSSSGQWNTLTLDGSGNPHIAYYGFGAAACAGAGTCLKYANYNGSSWQLQVVDGNSSTASKYHNAVVLDPSSNYDPHIIYSGLVPPAGWWRLKHARWTGSQWLVQIIDNVATDKIDAVSDSSGNIYVSYEVSSKLKFACYNGSSWSTTSLTSIDNNNIDHGTSIALDSSGEPYIAYFADQAPTYRVKMASCTGCASCGSGTWSTRDVNTSNLGSTVQAYPSLVISSTDENYVAYHAGSVDNAKEEQQQPDFPELPLYLAPLVIIAVLALVLLVRFRKNRI